MVMKWLATTLAMFCMSSLAFSGVRPYEFEWANRNGDDRPVLMRMEQSDGWSVSTTDSVATLTTGVERVLFGKGVMHLEYRATGKNPAVRLSPAQPVEVPPGSDTISLWIWGNNVSYARDKSTPPVRFVLHFVDSDGKPFSVDLYRVHHLEWFLVQKKLDAAIVARLKHGGKFVGLTVDGGKNQQDRFIEFTSLAVYHEELKPLEFKKRARRPNRVFPNAPAGVNVGPGSLDFPNRSLTIVPPTHGRYGEWHLPSKAWDWSDMGFSGPDGVLRRFAVGGGLCFGGMEVRGDFVAVTNSVAPLDVTYSGKLLNVDNECVSFASLRFHEEGKSLVLDLAADGGKVTEVRFGSAPDIPDTAKVFPVPYYSYGMKAGSAQRPNVAQFMIGESPCFFAAAMDWTQSNASEPYCAGSVDDFVSVHGGTLYREKTDGSRNPCFERFVWTFSTEFADVLPSIPNPPSPYRGLTARYEWCHMGAGNREKDKAYWRDRKRRRLDNVFVGDHEVCMRDGNESFTFRTRPAPKKGGDEGMRDFTRCMIDELGYLYGPYNNYTDFATVNGYWHADHMSRDRNGNLMPAWNRCYAPKPVWSVEMCELIVPELQRKFNFNSAYCDVHTCVSPWSRCDYDSRVPGSGTFAQTFYSFGELLELQRKFWNGPVYSEGGCHFMYVGLDDGNFAQDQGCRLDLTPWLVDFDLLRLHPLANNFGMGYPSMFYSSEESPKDKVFANDRFLAATIAFGHVGYFMTGNVDNEEQGYWMVQPIAEHYAQADVAKIRYADEQGRFLPTSVAIATGAYARSQVEVSYLDGTHVVVNGSAEGDWLSVDYDHGRMAIPANGWYAISGDRNVVSASLWRDGGRADACISPKAFYMDGRGKMFDSGHGATDGRLIRVFCDDGTEEIFVRRTQEVVLPYVAESIVKLDKAGKVFGRANVQVRNGRTVLRHDPAAYSYRSVRPKGYRELAAETLGDAFLVSKGWRSPAVVKRAPVYRLPERYIVGMIPFETGKEIPIDSTSGASVRMGTEKINGSSKTGFYMHPPYRHSQGVTFARWKLVLPESPLVFKVDVGKIERSSLGDGTLYRIEIDDGVTRHELASLQTNEHDWHTLTADLSPWKGKVVRMYLIADPGSARNHVADHSTWGDLRFEAR